MLLFLAALGRLLNLPTTVNERRRVLPSTEVDLLLLDRKVNRFVSLAVFAWAGATRRHRSVPSRYLGEALYSRLEHRRSIPICFLGAVVYPHRRRNAYLALFVDALVYARVFVPDRVAGH